MKTKDLQYLHENETHRFYRSYFQGHPLSKQNLNQHSSLASMVDFESDQQMMSDDRMLDLFNEFMNQGLKSQ